MMWLKFDEFFHFRVQRYDFPLKPAIHIYRDFAWEHNKCGTRFISDATLHMSYRMIIDSDSS